MTEQARRLVVLVERVTYKPGWKFVVEQDSKGVITLGVSYEAVNVVDGEGTMICSVLSISDCGLERLSDREMLTMYVGAVLRRAEMHEMDEWFRMDGVCVTNPHPERFLAKTGFSFEKAVT